MATIEDDRPRDSLGRPKRRLRYPVMVRGKVSEEAAAYLEKMAEERGTRPGTIVRRAVMKEIFIDKAKKEKKQ